MESSVSLKAIMAFFEMSSAEFSREWKKLSQKDKDDIKSAFTNGTMTY